MADAARASAFVLTAQLRIRSLAVGVTTGLIVFVALVPIKHDAPTLYAGLTGKAAPLIGISAVAGLATLVLLVARRFPAARLTAVLAGAAVVLGWGIAQYPWLLVDQVSIADAAGSPATLAALLGVVVLAAIIVVPAMAYLYSLTQSEPWTKSES